MSDPMKYVYAVSVAYRRDGQMGHSLEFVSSRSEDEARGRVHREHQKEGNEVASILLGRFPADMPPPLEAE